jgi:hypothetical protein
MIRTGCLPQHKAAESRALRGGSWNNSPGNARSAYRNQNHRDNDWHNNGFRLALSSRAPGGACRTRQHPAHDGGQAPAVAKRKGPGVLVGGPVEAGRRTLPGCSVSGHRTLCCHVA